MQYSEFKAQVIQHLGGEWEADMEQGFKDYSAEEGASKTSGYQFQLPAVSRSYSWGKFQGWYYSHKGGSGSGSTLEEASKQSNIIIYPEDLM